MKNSFGQLPRPDGLAKFRAHMRRLWVDYAVWLKVLSTGKFHDLPDVAVALGRLYVLADLMGQAFEPFVGAQNALRLRKLFKDHITLTARVIDGVKAEDGTEAKQLWYANWVLVASTLSKLNPRWPEAALVEVFKKHLDLVYQCFEARQKKDYSGELAAFNVSLDHMMRLADLLANGMIATILALTGKKRVTDGS